MRQAGQEKEARKRAEAPGSSQCFLFVILFGLGCAQFCVRCTSCSLPALAHVDLFSGESYNDPDGHCGPLCVIVLVATAVVLTNSTGPGQDEIRAYQNADNIVNNANDSVRALANLFRNDDLPGDTAQERLDWILGYAGSAGEGSLFGLPTLYTGAGLEEDGLSPELRDGGYSWYEDGSPSQQVGHFLTGVAYGEFSTRGDWQQEWALVFVVGHELSSDEAWGINGLGIPKQLMLGATNPGYLRRFELAAEYYDADSGSFRDALLFDIGGPSLGSASRVGNSIEDLRLSALGWNLGQAIGNGDITDRHAVADWILQNIGE